MHVDFVTSAKVLEMFAIGTSKICKDHLQILYKAINSSIVKVEMPKKIFKKETY